MVRALTQVRANHNALMWTRLPSCSYEVQAALVVLFDSMYDAPSMLKANNATDEMSTEITIDEHVRLGITWSTPVLENSRFFDAAYRRELADVRAGVDRDKSSFNGLHSQYDHGHFGLNALHLAAKGGQTAVVEYLLEHGALVDVLSLDMSADDGSRPTAMIFAASYHHPSTVKLLLDKGADVHAQGYDRSNALVQTLCGWASVRRSIPESKVNIPVVRDAVCKTITVLIEAGVDINQESRSKFCPHGCTSACSRPGCHKTARTYAAKDFQLTYAARARDYDVVKHVLGHEATPRSGSVSVPSALSHAFDADPSVLRLLLNHDAPVNPLDLIAAAGAACVGHLQTLYELASPSTIAKSQTALQAAALMGRLEQTKLLLD